MVLTPTELMDALQQEVRILLHLAAKVDDRSRDYRPTPKQRSTTELVKYLSMMGPTLVRHAKAGRFDADDWTAREEAALAQTFEQAVASIGSHAEAYRSLLADLTEDDYRAEVEMFGSRSSRGLFLVTQLLGACAAYRTQVFLYLKASGREELNTMNLWAGMDAPAA